MKKKMYIGVAAIALFSFIISLKGIPLIKLKQQLKSTPAISAVAKGEKAPAFSTKSIDGVQYRVGVDQQKVTLITFWASWCHACKNEMPCLQRIAEKYTDRLCVLAINATKYDTEKEAKTFFAQTHATFPMILDHEGKISDLYRITSFPTNILIDHRGVIRHLLLGVPSEGELDQYIKQLVDTSI